MKIVIDNNIFISGTFWKGAPHQIIKLAEENKFEIAVAPEIIEELSGVLQREKFKWLFMESETDFDEVIEKVLELVEIYPLLTKVDIIKDDPSDNIFLACALSAQASFIISGDRHLLNLKKFQNIPILTPQQFLNKFKKLK